jgi:hypothetical protein
MPSAEENIEENQSEKGGLREKVETSPALIGFHPFLGYYNNRRDNYFSRLSKNVLETAYASPWIRSRNRSSSGARK